MTTAVAFGAAWTSSAIVLAAIGAAKRAGHGSGPVLSIVDVAVLGLLAAAGPLSGSAWVTCAAAAAALASFGALWLDAVLFRVYSIELGLLGLRGIVLPVLYDELTEVAFARRFLLGRPALVCAPFAAAATLALPLLPVPLQAVTILVVVWIAGEAIIADPRLRPTIGESAFAAFVLPRRFRKTPAFQPREEHRVVLGATRQAASPSARHGAARGADLLLWTFESASRDALSLYGGRARTPFLESLAASGAGTSHHFAPCPMTTEAHQALYTSTYLGDGPSALGPLKAAGYRCVYLTPCRTSHYGLARILAALGFDASFDRVQLPSGRDSELLPRGLELALQAAEDRPLFLHVHTANGHLPYLVEDAARFGRFPSDDDQGRYLNSLEEADALLERFAAAFSAARRSAPLLAVSSDHGQSFGERGYRSHGSAVTKEQVNVPFVLSHSAVGRAQWRWSSHFDVLPTLLDLAGVADERAHFGQSVFLQPDRVPSLVLWAGRPARSTTSHIGLLHGDRKYLYDLVVDQTLAMDWSDAAIALGDAEGKYQRQLLAYAFSSVGLR